MCVPYDITLTYCKHDSIFYGTWKNKQEKEILFYNALAKYLYS